MAFNPWKYIGKSTPRLPKPTNFAGKYATNPKYYGDLGVSIRKAIDEQRKRAYLRSRRRMQPKSPTFPADKNARKYAGINELTPRERVQAILDARAAFFPLKKLESEEAIAKQRATKERIFDERERRYSDSPVTDPKDANASQKSIDRHYARLNKENRIGSNYTISMAENGVERRRLVAQAQREHPHLSAEALDELEYQKSIDNPAAGSYVTDSPKPENASTPSKTEGNGPPRKDQQETSSNGDSSTESSSSSKEGPNEWQQQISTDIKGRSGGIFDAEIAANKDARKNASLFDFSVRGESRMYERLGSNRENLLNQMQAMKNGDELSKLMESKGITYQQGMPNEELLNNIDAHFKQQAQNGPTSMDVFRGNNGLGFTGLGVAGIGALSLANSKGQMSNSQLYSDPFAG